MVKRPSTTSALAATTSGSVVGSSSLAIFVLVANVDGAHLHRHVGDAAAVVDAPSA